MGLGKTITALAALEADNAWPAVVIAPASMKLVWRDELAKWFPLRDAHVLAGRNGTDLGMTPADLYIVNYDIVSGWKKPLLHVGLKAVVLDECHYVRNTGTARIKAAKALTAQVARNGGMLLGLTGTPMHLHPDNLRVQLEVLRRLDDLGGYPLFKSRYSNGDNAIELHQRLRATCYLRRTKDMKGVADELPPQMPPVVLRMEGSKDGLAEYRRAEKDTAKWFADRAAELALELGEDPGSAAVKAKMRAESALHLVRIAALKRLAAKAKMPAVIEWVQDFLQGGRKLVIFAHHREVVDALADQFGALKIQGGMTADQRLAVVQRFQSDSDQKVIVMSLQAGGVGLTLTAASDVLFVEMGWSPAEHDQGTGRCDRIGQTSPVTPFYAVCANTYDEDNWALLNDRRRIMNAIVDGRAMTDDERAVLDPYEAIRRFQEGS
jgi:SNF2 family DNA or RNA helicase